MRIASLTYFLCCALFCLLLTAAEAKTVAAPPESVRSGPRLLLQDAQGRELFSCAAPEGFSFAIRYIHSVAKTPVEDWFQVSGQTLYLEKTVYEDFGAGLPHMPEAGQTMTTAHGKISISGFHRALPSFDVRVGRIAEHTLLLPGAGHAVKPQDAGTAPAEGAQTQGMREIPLSDLAAAGSAITISLRP